MQYGSIPEVKKPISRIVFGTATPKMFAAFRSVYGEAPDWQQRLDAAFALLQRTGKFKVLIILGSDSEHITPADHNKKQPVLRSAGCYATKDWLWPIRRIY